MIRDPSDGSVKIEVDQIAGKSPIKGNSTENINDLTRSTTRPTSAENWGLKSLDREARKPAPAPTIDELRAHYARHGLGFKPKQTEGN